MSRPTNHRVPEARTATRGLAFLVVCTWTAAAAADEPVDFARQVRPILSDKCFHCHGPAAEDRQAELRLDDASSATMDRGGYAVIVAGQPDESELIRRIDSSDEFERMPPPESGKSLTDEERATLRRWIQQGAEWQQHWAYQVPLRVAVPQVRDPAWPRTWVDHFILARLEREELPTSPDADRVTLIRRLSFDLTGLPPSPEQVRAFAHDSDPQAYERLVDRLLASPAFGERMAMYWLDLVRYADTVGYHGDQDHNISPYRDYVIQAFNDNLPFDQFTRDQLAGDLIPDPSIEQLVASGYNRMLQTSHEGGVQPKEYLSIYAADRVRNLSAVWLGGTLGCAQCHDHKYDPYTTHDFYSMVAFFADLDEAQHFKVGNNNLPTARPPEIDVLDRPQRQRVAELEAEITGWKAELSQLQETGADSQPIQQRIAEARQRIEQIRTQARRTMISVPIEPRTIRVLPRGNWLDDSGPIVEPAIPAFLGRLEVGDRRANRWDLANWLTDAQGGAGLLTARVFVNRFWYLMFGRGLAPVLDDFGGQGEAPTHPQLLDALAHEFVDSGWDVKHLIKLLVTSRAYQQSSLESERQRQRDPLNQLFARQSRYRLPAEMIRDQALLVSGLLVDQLGGASAKPYQPAHYYRHLNFPKREYEPDTDRNQWRRGLYVHWQRQFLHPWLRAFDAPSREECTASRPRSNTPLASLTLLNDPTFVETARMLAARALADDGLDNQQRLDRIYQRVVSRSPDDVETKVLLQLLERQTDHYQNEPQQARKLLSIGLIPYDDRLDAAQWAAWTSVARVVLNTSECITRN